MLANQIPAIRATLADQGLDGWFFGCFQHNDPVSQQLLGIAEGQLISRRCYYFLPTQGEPRKLVHALEPAMLGHLPGEETKYLTWQQHSERLAELVSGSQRIVAQYSPDNSLPSISRLDAGTAEFLRRQGIELVSSADLVQRFAAVWSTDQLDGHRRASTHLHRIVAEAFKRVGSAVREGAAIDEYSVQKFILRSFEAADLWTEADPIVGVNAHSADPHYQPGPDRSAPIDPGDFLLIDLWAKEKRTGSVYADICWCGVCAASPTDRQEEIFRIVAGARDAGLALVQDRFPAQDVRGFEVDDASRRVIEEAGYGEWFIHRTGHSLGIEDHGHGANMDNLETHDTRPLLPLTGFSIEPGIYFPGDFGIRSEINVALTLEGVEVTGGEPQRDLLRLMA